MNVISFNYDDRDELFSNSYILIDSKHNCVVVDPSANNDGLISYIEKKKLTLKAVLLTHCHFDHIQGVDLLINKYNVPLYVSNDDIPGLTDEEINCSYFTSNKVEVKSTPSPINDGDVLKELEEDIEVISTPYHTIGSVCYYLKNSNILFSGDTLMKDNIGRDDLPTACPTLKNDTMSKIIRLPENIKVYPGHGKSTTIGSEKKFNPFIKR